MHILHDLSDYFIIAYRLLVQSCFISTAEAFDAHYTSGVFLRHAMKSPLTAITLNLETSLEFDQNHQAYAHRALAAARYLADLFRPHQQAHFDVLCKINQVAEVLSLPKQKKFVYVISKLDGRVKLDGDDLLFQEAMGCLITNGFEAYSSDRHKIVVVSMWAEKNHLLVTVTDFGTGMTWLTKKLSMAKGFSIKRRNSGYGLWFVEKIIDEQFHGKVMIGSQSDVGTSIKIQLPLLNS